LPPSDLIAGAKNGNQIEEESIHVLDISNAPTPMGGTSFVRGLDRDT
jgi:hypothetical protein